ncbi:hypothetical protein MVEG_00755 [Podila verticillata NRRL 6337]|nr:hypothetical protein MVEG_00755 [Podila verticillata NRRL 6337]
MTTAPPDPVFDELTTIPGHVASFSADLATGQLLNVKGDIHQNQATTIQKLMQDVGQLRVAVCPGGPHVTLGRRLGRKSRAQGDHHDRGLDTGTDHGG